MPNHIHIIWQAKGNNNLQKIQISFIKHTSKEFKKLLEQDNNLQAYEVNAIDRKYNFWQRDSLNIELFTKAVFHQKLNYMHYNPVMDNLWNLPEDYYFTSALLYEKGIDHFSFIEHYLGKIKFSNVGSAGQASAKVLLVFGSTVITTNKRKNYFFDFSISFVFITY